MFVVPVLAADGVATVVAKRLEAARALLVVRFRPGGSLPHLMVGSVLGRSWGQASLVQVWKAREGLALEMGLFL